MIFRAGRLPRPLKGLLALALLLSFAGCGDQNRDDFVFTNTQPQAVSQRRLLAVYMVGSDLESKYGAATDDLNEMVDGLGRLSAAEVEQLDLFIAFGGADQDGWRGVKWMDRQGLLTDSRDGVYGNEPAEVYLAVGDGQNMASSETLTNFLSAAAIRQVGTARSFLDFWDHGGSYRGYGYDENFKEILGLPQMRQSMDDSRLAKLDLLGFDACLMASVEVAQTFLGTSRLLVASEETEPGHGWNYRFVVPAYVQSADMVNYARGLVDNYVDDASHDEESDGKTLSVLDLGRYPEVAAALDRYAGEYTSALAAPAAQRGFARAVTVSQAFGVSGDGSRYSIDLEDFLGQSVFFDAIGQAAGAELLTALDGFVLYVQNDGTLETTLGVTILPPDRTARNVAPALMAGNGWRGLVVQVLALIAQDVTGPVLTSLTPTATGFEAEFTDQLLTRVSAIHGLATPGGDLLRLFQAPARPIPGGQRWAIDNWDGRAIHLLGGATPQPLPLDFLDNARDDNGQPVRIFGAQIQLLEATDPDAEFDNATLFLSVSASGAVTDYEVRTTVIDDQGNEIEGKTIENLQAGDQLRIFAQTFSVGSQSEPQFQQLGDTIVLAAAPQFESQIVQASGGNTRAFAVMAEDLAGNVTLSPLQPAP